MYGSSNSGSRWKSSHFNALCLHFSFLLASSRPPWISPARNPAEKDAGRRRGSSQHTFAVPAFHKYGFYVLVTYNIKRSSCALGYLGRGYVFTRKDMLMVVSFFVNPLKKTFANSDRFRLLWSLIGALLLPAQSWFPLFPIWLNFISLNGAYLPLGQSAGAGIHNVFKLDFGLCTAPTPSLF